MVLNPTKPKQAVCPRCETRMVQAYADMPITCIACGYEDYTEYTEIDLTTLFDDENHRLHLQQPPKV